MAFLTSTTGSFPPIPLDKPYHRLSEAEREEWVHKSIKQAINDQIELEINVLVDGQVRGDIVSLFCPHIHGFKGNRLPYHVTEKVRPADAPITLADFEYARSLAGGRPMKAHITGPMTIANGSVVEAGSGYSGKTDRQLVFDIAKALAQEARFFVEAGLEIVQIDEPVLADGADLGLAFEAMKFIVETARIHTPALHACGNVSGILVQMLKEAPVEIISIEGNWLREDELAMIDRTFLRGNPRKLGLGCIDVWKYEVENPRVVANFIDPLVTRLGEEHIWAIMPNCGLRLLPRHIALDKLRALVAAVRSI